MNENIEKILQQNINDFLKLVELGIINKELGTEAVINSKLAEFIYYFARYIKGANIKKLEDGIIKTQNIEYIHYFARDIKGANKERLLAEIERIKINIKIKEEQEKKSSLTALVTLLKEKKYEEILNNKEEYLQLFIDDNQNNNQEMTRTLEIKNDENE